MFKAIPFKNQATLLGKVFAERGINLTRSEKLELLARIHGAKSWNALTAQAEKLDALQQAALKAYRPDLAHCKTEKDVLHSGDALALLIVREAPAADSDADVLAHRLHELAGKLLETAARLPGREEPLRDFELSHAEHSDDVEYGQEAIVRTLSGFNLHTSTHPDGSDYVRVVDNLGREVMYWCCDEWQESPEEVMGAIIGALRPGFSDSASRPAPIKKEPEDLTLKAYKLVFLKVFEDDGGCGIEEVMEHLQHGSQYEGLDVEQWLRQLNPQIVLNDPYDTMQVRVLFSRIKQMAKTVYEKLFLNDI